MTNISAVVRNWLHFPIVQEASLGHRGDAWLFWETARIYGKLHFAQGKGANLCGICIIDGFFVSQTVNLRDLVTSGQPYFLI